MFRFRLKAFTYRKFFWTLAILLLVAVIEGRPINAMTLRPTCKINLSFLGKGGVFPLARLIEFVNNSTLAVAMIAHNPGSPNLVHRGEPGANPPYFLHSALFDAHTGGVLKRARWPSENLYRSGLIAVPDSKLLVLLGDRVVLFNDDLEQIKQLRLPRGGEHGWLASASPTGRNVLFQEDTSDWPGPSTWVWVDAENLSIRHVWKNVVRQGPAAISDDYMTFAVSLPKASGLPCKLLIWSLHTGPVERLSGVRYTAKTPEFVGENLLFALVGGNWSIVNLQQHGHASRRNLGPFDMLSFASPVRAAGSARFVIPLIFEDQGGSELQRLYVYDSATARRRVVKLHGLSSMAWRLGWFPFSSNWLALSPDGRLLAIMKNFKTVLIYRLPPAESQ